MKEFFDALANAQLSLVGVLPRSTDPVRVLAGEDIVPAQHDMESTIKFDESHYRLAAG